MRSSLQETWQPRTAMIGRRSACGLVLLALVATAALIAPSEAKKCAELRGGTRSHNGAVQHSLTRPPLPARTGAKRTS